jgi:hypothetical protein
MARHGVERKFPRRDCELCVGLLCTRQGIRTVRTGKIWLHNVSEEGAMASTRMKDLPTHFYIYFGEYQYFIGCIVVGSGDDMLHLKFIRPQTTDFIDILSRITDPLEFRERVRLELYGLPEKPGTRGLAGSTVSPGA